MGNNICAIIVSYNCDEEILSCIDGIKDQVSCIVVVDNGSNSDAKVILKKIEDEGIKVIYNTNNMGIANALNQGVRYAESKEFNWVITLDQDSIATKDMVKNMLEVYDDLSDGMKKVVFSIVPEHVEQKVFEGAQAQVGKSEIKSNEVLTDITSGNLLKTDIFHKIGYYNEVMFIDCIDHEFCMRLCKSGYKMIKVYNAILLHNLGEVRIKKVLSKTMYSTNHSAVRRYYITRNRHYIWNLYGSDFTDWVKNDKKAAFMDFIKIIFFEKDKLLKVKMIIKGYLDNKKGRFGELK